MFLLQGGFDPLPEVVKFSKEYNLSDENFPKRSLGVGQEDYAEKCILKAREKGQWIMLQNLDVCPSFHGLLENRL